MLLSTLIYQIVRERNCRMVDSYRYPGRIGISVKIVSDATVFHKETMKPAACGLQTEDKPTVSKIETVGFLNSFLDNIKHNSEI